MRRKNRENERSGYKPEHTHKTTLGRFDINYFRSCYFSIMPISFKSLKVGARVVGSFTVGGTTETYTGTVVAKRLNRAFRYWEALVKRDDEEEGAGEKGLWIVTYSKNQGFWLSNEDYGNALEFITKETKIKQPAYKTARANMKKEEGRKEKELPDLSKPCGCDEELAEAIHVATFSLSPKEMLEMMEEAAEIAAMKVPEPKEKESNEGGWTAGCTLLISMFIGVLTAPMWYDLFDMLRLAILNWLVGK